MNKKLTVKEPKQILRNLSGQRFIPIPLRTNRHQNGLHDWAHNTAAELCGEGVQLKTEGHPDDGNYYREMLVLVQDYKDQPGDWILRYGYTRNDGICKLDIYLAAELV